MAGMTSRVPLNQERVAVTFRISQSLGPAEKLDFSHPRLRESNAGYRCICLQMHTFVYIEMTCIITITSLKKA